MGFRTRAKEEQKLPEKGAKKQKQRKFKKKSLGFIKNHTTMDEMEDDLDALIDDENEMEET